MTLQRGRRAIGDRLPLLDRGQLAPVDGDRAARLGGSHCPAVRFPASAFAIMARSTFSACAMLNARAMRVNCAFRPFGSVR
jgi:hypothetical protein